jgi:hypothetical protein
MGKYKLIHPGIYHFKEYSFNPCLKIDCWQDNNYKSIILFGDVVPKINLEYTTKEEAKEILCQLIDEAEIIE